MASFSNIPNRTETFILEDGEKKIEYEKLNNTFTIMKEDHTVGNIMQIELLSTPHVTFAGYNKKHPFENKITIRVETDGTLTPVKAFQNAIRSINKKLKQLLKDFRDSGKGKNNNISIQTLNENVVKFSLKQTDISIANSLRRVIISEIPTMAFDFFNIKKNDSVLHDEFLENRLGLIPIQVDNIDDFSVMNDCPCKDNMCDKCTIEFTLTASCDGNTKSIYSNDLINHRNPGSGRIMDDILIVELSRGQVIDCELIARKSIGIEDAKWQPVSIASCYNEGDKVIFNVETLNMRPEIVIKMGVEILMKKLSDLMMEHDSTKSRTV